MDHLASPHQPDLGESPADAAAAKIALQADRLDELAELGMRWARAATGAALAPDSQAGDAGIVALGLVFSRAAHVVHNAITLDAKLDADRALAARRTNTKPARPPDRRRPSNGSAPGRRCGASATPSKPRRAALPESEMVFVMGDVDCWISTGKVDDQICRRPMGEIVAEMCRALHVMPDLSSFSDEERGSAVAEAPPSDEWEAEKAAWAAKPDFGGASRQPAPAADAPASDAPIAHAPERHRQYYLRPP